METMRVLVFAGISPNTFVYMMDEAELHYQLGHEVYFVYCTPELGMCWENMQKNPMKCNLCSRYFNRMRKKLSRGIHQLGLSSFMDMDIIHEVKNATIAYNTVEEIKRLEYKGVHLGMASLSTYISHTRNCNPKIEKSFHLYFDELLRNSMIRTLLIEKILKTISPDKVILFNGRATDAKSEWELCQKYNIPFISCESICVFPNKYLKRYFYNAIPHSIRVNSDMIQQQWKNSVLPEKEKIHIGSYFFLKRSKGEYAGDKNYLLNQSKDKLPNNWDKNKRNIVIFNSSEDEFIAIGDDFDKVKLFKDQLDAIKHIATLLNKQEDVSLYLRIHPNLSKIPYKYHTGLFSFEKTYKRLTVIRGDSNISTYALIKHADLVVVWGSTTGVEAVYNEKPTILLGGSIYRELNITYNPKSIEELDTLLLDKSLKPKDRLNAIKLGFYYMNYLSPSYTFWPYNFKAYTWQIGKMRHSCLLYDNQSLLGSKRLYYLVTKSIIGIYKAIFRKKVLNIPLKEN